MPRRDGPRMESHKSHSWQPDELHLGLDASLMGIHCTLEIISKERHIGSRLRVFLREQRRDL